MALTYPLICPVCESALEMAPSAARCAQGHSFDVAREGYVNLLPPQHRTRGIDGDHAEMLHARRRFLEAGHYLPLHEAVTDMAVQALAEQTTRGASGAHSRFALEVGCGEGYYVGGLATRLAGEHDVRAMGTDLSKHAARLGAKRYPDVLFFVADVNRRLYVASGSVALLLDVFAPRNHEEFARVVQPSGSMLVVIPSETHLASLRDRLGLLGVQEDKERRVIDRFSADFGLAERVEVEFPIHLTAEAVGDLVAMGPNYWHRDAAPGHASDEPADTDASFVMLRFVRTG